MVFPNYSATFRDLLCLHKDFDILTLVQDKLPAQKPEPVSTTSFFLKLIMVETPKVHPDYQKQVKKIFRKKIEGWTDTLDTELEEVRFTPKLLKALQEVVYKIFSERKLMILEEKLESHALLDEKMKNLLIKIKIHVRRTLLTPSLEKLRIRSKKNAFFTLRKNDKATLELLPTPRKNLMCLLLPGESSFTSAKNAPRKDASEEIRRSKSDSDLWESSSRCPVRPGKENQEVDNHEILELIAIQKQSLHHQQRACEISIFNYSWGKEWKEKLLPAFEELKEEGAICAVAEKLDTLQVLQIINRFLDDQKHEWKLIYLFGSIKHTTFVEMIQSFEGNILTHLNEILRRSSPESIKWFQEAFRVQRDGFIESCNNMKNLIDALAKRFRDDIEGHNLRETDLYQIYELVDHIALTMNVILEKLDPFLRDVITHPETRHVLFVGLKKDYKTHMTRLTETRDYDERPAGCLFPIIYRNIFERTELGDLDEAYDIFADWGIFRIEDYREAGLYGRISNDLYAKLNLQSSVVNPFQLATNHLAKLGIKTIADWKRLKIFNLSLLKIYLAKKEISESLSKWTAESVQ